MSVKFYKVKSETTPGKEYTIRVMPDGTFRCSCPAFVFREECKHVTKLKDRIEKWKNSKKNISK